MRVRVTGDLHLGSRHSDTAAFTRFLDALPADAALVLNGDVIDRLWRQVLPPAHMAVLDRLRAESRRRDVVWVRGNHDLTYDLPNPAGIRFVEHYSVGRRLYVAHGARFTRLLPHHRLFMLIFKTVYDLLARVGADSLHIAVYAKRFRFLYRRLCRGVALRATAYARSNSFEAVCCGHTHAAEDTRIDGIRYLNTGAWTEAPAWYVDVTDTDIRLERFEPSGPA